MLPSHDASPSVNLSRGPARSSLRVVCASVSTKPEPSHARQVLALARKMMDGRTKQDILDSSYHRYAFHDTGVPKWFYEDEKRHMRRASSLPSKPGKTWPHVALWDTCPELQAGGMSAPLSKLAELKQLCAGHKIYLSQPGLQKVFNC